MQSKGFYSDPSKLSCFRVWCGDYAVLVDANSEAEARAHGAKLLECEAEEITRVQKLDAGRD